MVIKIIISVVRHGVVAYASAAQDDDSIHHILFMFVYYNSGSANTEGVAV